ncbi:MAG: DUF559 domain-containing protein [Asticcacaulis sp.]
MRTQRSKLTPLARALRRSGNIAEARLWNRLRNRNLGGFKFYRSFVIGDYMADFACPELHLIIELDGSQHSFEKDKERNDFILAKGWSIARFPSGDMLSNPNVVLDTIVAICENRITDHSVDHDFQFYPRCVMDTDYMQQAIALGLSQMGRTWPNPAVGCVIVKDGAVIAEGSTGDGGRPHAEEKALELAGNAARGATAYVTLEPCGRRSQGGCSCAQRLIEAGVARVIYACSDPSPYASNLGTDAMRAAGIEVASGLLADSADRLIAPGVHYYRTGLPLVQISETDTGFDAEFITKDGDLAPQLKAWAERGYRHLYVRPGSEMAAQLQAQSLLTL